MFGIDNEAVIEETNRRTGEVYRKQWGYFEQDGQKIPFQFGLGDNPAFKKGAYQLSPRGFGTNRYHKLELNFVVLEPMVAEVRKTA